MIGVVAYLLLVAIVLVWSYVGWKVIGDRVKSKQITDAEGARSRATNIVLVAIIIVACVCGAVGQSVDYGGKGKHVSVKDVE